MEFKHHLRSNSIKSILKPLPRVQGKLLSKYEESFIIKSSKLWNTLPSKLTHTTNLNSFKEKLDIFLKSIPDEPPLPGYHHRNDNSLPEQCLFKNRQLSSVLN